MAGLLSRLNANKGKNPCAKAFGGLKKALSKLNGSNFSFKDLGGPVLLGDRTLYSSPDAATDGENIIINTKGRFYMENLSLPFSNAPGRMTDLSRFDYGTPGNMVDINDDVVAASFVLAHELGHRAGTYKNDNKDAVNDKYGTGAEKTARNNQKIYDACFK